MPALRIGRVRPLATLGYLLLASACGDNAPEPQADARPPDEIEAIPFESTIELDDDGLSLLQESAEDGTLRFDGVPDALRDVEVGNVLVAGVGPQTPSGLLRAVISVDREAGDLVLRTAQIPIQLAYRKLHIRVARTTATASHPNALTQRPGRSSSALMAAPSWGGRYDASEPFDYVLFDGDGDLESTDDQIAIEGAIGGGFDYELGVDVDWGNVTALPGAIIRCIENLLAILEGELPSCSIDDLIPEAKVGLTMHPTIHADANVRGAAILSYAHEFDLASTTLTPILLGPIVLVPVVDLTAKLDGGASATFSTGVRGSAVFETSVALSSKRPGMAQFQEPELVETNFEPNETRVGLHAYAKVGVGARLNLLLFGVTGPYATARAYAELSADVLRTPCWALQAGIEAELGVKITSPALPLLGTVTLVDWRAPTVTPLELEIGSGECEAPAMDQDVPALPPGAGPDATRLARPSFTPWSRTYASPVEGSIAGSPGNLTGFADVQRTIDGRTVRAGWGVVALTKIDGDDGEPVWSRQLELDGQVLEPLRVAPTTAGTLMVLSSAITPQLVLTELAQDGRVVGARGFDIPFATCTLNITSLVSDGSGGFYAAGACVGRAQSFVLRVLRDAYVLRLLSAGELNGFKLRTAAAIDGDAFLAGTLNDGRDAMFALRMRSDGEVVYGKRYQGCAQAWDAVPSQALVGERGEVTIAGSGGAVHNGVVVRLLPDGRVGFASFPGFGFGAGSVFVLDSIAQLPTTGYVAGGSLVRFTSENDDLVPSAALVGLDGSGRIQWARRYRFGGPSTYAAAGQVGVHLTDDGGVLATALVADRDDPLGGLLWAFKAFAKDGDIALLPDSAERAPLPIANLDCSLSDEPLAIIVDEGEVSAGSLEVTARDFALSVQAQTDG